MYKIFLSIIDKLNKKYKKITNLKDALNNKGKLHPSPKILSKKLKEGHKLKFIKLKKIDDKELDRFTKFSFKRRK